MELDELVSDEADGEDAGADENVDEVVEDVSGVGVFMAGKERLV